MPYIQNALTFTTETLIGLYLIAIILRFLFQLFRVDFRNPISQTIVTVTNPPLKFLRRFIPGVYGIDMASVVLMLFVAMIKTAILLSLSAFPINLPGVFVLSLSEVLSQIIWIMLIAIIISAILSWVAPTTQHPAARLVSDISQPVLRPFRRLLPAMGGIDITPIFAFLALRLGLTLLVAPLTDLGRQLLLG